MLLAAWRISLPPLAWRWRSVASSQSVWGKDASGARGGGTTAYHCIHATPYNRQAITDDATTRLQHGVSFCSRGNSVLVRSSCNKSGGETWVSMARAGRVRGGVTRTNRDKRVMRKLARGVAAHHLALYTHWCDAGVAKVGDLAPRMSAAGEPRESTRTHSLPLTFVPRWLGQSLCRSAAAFC